MVRKVIFKRDLVACLSNLFDQLIPIYTLSAIVYVLLTAFIRKREIEQNKIWTIYLLRGLQTHFLCLTKPDALQHAGISSSA